MINYAACLYVCLSVCLLVRFDEAVDQYHRALSLQPSLSFVTDMLTQALSDMSSFPSLDKRCNSSYSQEQHQQHDQGEGVFEKHAHVIEALFLPSEVIAPRDFYQPQGLELGEGEKSMLSQLSAVSSQHGGVLEGYGVRNDLTDQAESSFFATPNSFDLSRSRGGRGGRLSYGESSFVSGQRSSTGGMSLIEGSDMSLSMSGSWQGDDSGASYSRIAGRLSLNSTMSNRS